MRLHYTKLVALILILFFTSINIFAQDITGQWYGLLKISGIELRLVLNIAKTDSGYVSTLDSPDQKATNIPVTATSYINPVLKFAVSNLKVTYEGTVNKDKIIVGTFTQSGHSVPLNLSREKTDKVEKVKYQEPKKPYPYYSEEVQFENKVAKITLAGTLTLPQKEGKFPVVVLISGSGPQNRDEEMLGHKPFLVLSDYLTKNGIAVLRYDDRGVALSKGDFKSATSKDFATDVEAAIAFLRTRNEINLNSIGLIGHSEGGIIAPMVAGKDPAISFIVLMAGTGIPGGQLLLLQQQLIGKDAGVSDADLQKNKVVNKGAFDIITKYNNEANLKADLTNYIQKTIKDIPAALRAKGVSDEDLVNGQVEQLTMPWTTYFIKYNPAIILQKIKCPVLAINGANDLQVPAKINLEAIKAALLKGGNKNVTTMEFPNLNHLFQESKTGSPSEYANIDQTISPLVLEEIAKWILKQVKN